MIPFICENVFIATGLCCYIDLSENVKRRREKETTVIQFGFKLSYQTFFKKIKSLKIQSQILRIIEFKRVNSTNGLYKPRVIVKNKL